MEERGTGFWGGGRVRVGVEEVTNVLQEGRETEGGKGGKMDAEFRRGAREWREPRQPVNR